MHGRCIKDGYGFTIWMVCRKQLSGERDYAIPENYKRHVKINNEIKKVMLL